MNLCDYNLVDKSQDFGKEGIPPRSNTAVFSQRVNQASDRSNRSGSGNFGRWLPVSL